jgi:hypothetical protein
VRVKKSISDIFWHNMMNLISIAFINNYDIIPEISPCLTDKLEMAKSSDSDRVSSSSVASFSVTCNTLELIPPIIVCYVFIENNTLYSPYLMCTAQMHSQGACINCGIKHADKEHCNPYQNCLRVDERKGVPVK